MRVRIRQIVSLVLVVLMTAGCSRAIEIPRDRFEEASHVMTGVVGVRMTDGSRYAVRRFVVTDSTLVIQELQPATGWYKTPEVPITLRLSDVASIQQYELDRERSFFLLTGLGLLAAFIAIAATFEIPSD